MTDEIPTLDVRPVCRGIALQSADPGVGQGAQAQTFQQCIESEKQVREELKKRWGEFSAADKRHCVTLAKTGGESSNTELLTCLEMARDVRVLRSTAAARSEPTKPASSLSTPTAPATPTEVRRPSCHRHLGEEVRPRRRKKIWIRRRAKPSEPKQTLKSRRHRKHWLSVNLPMPKQRCGE